VSEYTWMSYTHAPLMFQKFWKICLISLFTLTAWIAWDILIPRPYDIREFEPVQMGKLEAAMWKSYYEQKPLQLFGQLTQTMRTQFKAPFWKSVQLGYFATKAALTFQEGKERKEYLQALPYLECYYQGIQNLSFQSINIEKAARHELEWWIIRREPHIHSPNEWKTWIAEIAETLYQKDDRIFQLYAHLRVEAMLKRDALGTQITDEDWREIEEKLQESWMALYTAVHKPSVRTYINYNL